jgi:hypothetical protein
LLAIIAAQDRLHLTPWTGIVYEWPADPFEGLTSSSAFLAVTRKRPKNIPLKGTFVYSHRCENLYWAASQNIYRKTRDAQMGHLTPSFLALRQ